MIWVKWLPVFLCLFFINPLTPIGSPVTHVNWPMKWPDFAASPAHLGWPARSRHMHASIFSHTRMTTRAGSLVYVRVKSGHSRAHEDISGPTDHFQLFWNCYGSQRVIQMLHRSCCITLWRPLGPRWPTWIDLWTDPISPRRCRILAGLHAADTLWHAMHASIFSHTRMTTRAGSLVYVWVKSGRGRAREDISGLPFPAVLKLLWVSKG